MRPGNPTLDRGFVYRCMLVGFDEASARTCAIAVSPLGTVRVSDTREACEKMSSVLPLVVLVAESTPARDTSELGELAIACGAEVITVSLPVDGASLGRRILDALRTSEARRVPR